MKFLYVSIFVLATVLLPSPVNCRPKGGKFTNLILNLNSSSLCKGSCFQTCTNLVLQANSPISVTIDKVDTNTTSNADILFGVEIFESGCAKIDEKICGLTEGESIYQIYSVVNSDTKTKLLTDNEATSPPTPTPKKLNKRDTAKEELFTFKTNATGIFIVRIYASSKTGNKSKEAKPWEANITFTVEMKNSYGYLSLIDYPAMIVYSILLVLYVFLSFSWLSMLGCYYKDLVQLQFWILAVIILGFLEKVFFVAEYSTVNEGLQSWGLIYIAEGVSSAKRALSRMLLIIVCEGFGTVKPRLGSTLTPVVGVGVLYFIIAFIEGAIRGGKLTTDHQDLLPVLALGLLVLVDCGIIYWIFSSLVNTRRQLRLRKNFVKMSLYNHLAYTLIFACIASAAFLVWWFVELKYNDCVKDWKEVWLKDCYWHILFCFILIVIMILWRPSANNQRFAYSLVMNNDEDEEEQGPNKNFETLKMRQVTRSDSSKPVISAEAEEDLKWVEQNLPTTTLDKGISLVVDSEEEEMTTMFEMSKKE